MTLLKTIKENPGMNARQLIVLTGMPDHCSSEGLIRIELKALVEAGKITTTERWASKSLGPAVVKEYWIV